MSPGRSTVLRGQQLDAKNKRKADFACTREAKRRRQQLKRERNNDDELQELREGDTYETNIGKLSTWLLWLINSKSDSILYLLHLHFCLFFAYTYSHGKEYPGIFVKQLPLFL